MPLNFKRFRFVILLLFGICFYTPNFVVKFGGLVKAQALNTLIPCQDTRFPDFHSLRPQPASICQVAVLPSAAFCGNDLTLHETVTKTYVPGDPNCTTSGNTVTCNYTSSVPSHTVTIDLSGANLPFMGNTEDVINSQNSTETLNDADKVNGYVSWYLNGIINRAEYGGTKNTGDNLINYSGPIQKLLPQAILDAQRIQTVLNPYLGTNHNQTVVCAYGNTPVGCYPPVIGSTYYKLSDWIGDLSLWNDVTNAITGFINNLTNLFPLVPRNLISQSIGDHWNQRVPPLPWGNDPSGKLFTDITFQKAYNEWGGKTCAIIPVINILICANNIFVPDKWADLYPYIPLSSTEDLKGSITVDNVSNATSPSTGGVTVSGVTFSGQTPSTLFFPHMQESTELASSLQNTFVASSEQGNKTAAPTDVSTSAICSTVEVRSNKGDKLFATSLSGNLAYTASFSCTFTAPPPPTSCTANNTCMSPGVSCCSGYSHYDMSCSTIEARCTAATSTPTPDPYCSKENGSCIDPHYCCTGYDCNSQNVCHLAPTTSCSGACVSRTECSDGGGTVISATGCASNTYCCNFPTPPPTQSQSCTKDVYIALSTTGNIPKVDDIWSQLVAGPESIFKRIFPKTNTEGSVGQIIDIPGSTNITYSGSGVSQGTADLKFPHLGGISEYFLKGIQTALRPKGYGEPISFGPNTTLSDVSPGNIDICSASCNADPTNVNMAGVKESFIDKANRWFGGPGSARIDKFDQVVNTATSRGIDPIFLLATWLHESGGSNYLGACLKLGKGDPSSEYCQKTLDFGINDASIATRFSYNGSTLKVTADNFDRQLNGFLGIPSYYLSQCKTTTAKCPMEMFGAMYKWGECNPSANSNGYIATTLQIYGWLAPNQALPCYPIKLP